MKSAWVKWVYGKHAGGDTIEDKYTIIGAGGKLLVGSELGRLDNVKDMAAVLVSLTEIAKETKLGQYTNKQRKTLEENPHFAESELGHSLGKYERDLAHMIQGDAFYNIRKFEESMNSYDLQLQQMREEDDPNEPDVKVLAMIYGRKGRIELAKRSWDRAILNYDRQRSLATEIESDVEWASAFMGLGEGYLGKGLYEDARVLFEQAMLKCMVIGDKVRQAKAYRGVQVSYERLYNPLYAARFKEKADKLTLENANRIENAFSNLDDMKARLIDTTASMGEVIDLERITAGCITMRIERIKIEEKVKESDERLVEQTKTVDASKELLRKIKEQLEEAKTTDKDEMNSALVHEKEQVFEIEELKMRLAERQKKVEVEVEEQVRVQRKIKQEGLNLEDDLRMLDQDLAVEQGPLMKQVVKRKILRGIGLNPSNTAGNEVTGTATGGIEFVVGVDTNNVNLYDIHTGVLKLVFSGDEENRHVGEPLGHTSVITSVLFHDAKIYTGSMDTTVMCWDIESEQREWTGHGHESTVTCLYVDMYKLITGAADTKIIIWNKSTGQMIKLVHGHSRGVSCIHSGPTWFCSGSADGEIRVWANLHPDEDPKYKSVTCQKRLKGHGCKVTVVKYGKLEIISGDSSGYVIVWWLKTGDIVQRCKAHTGVITDLQFDATKIVTSGVDHNLQLIDITTGEILQTLRGHEGPVVSLAFDSMKIMSASSDGTLRHWEWGSASKKPDKLHVFDSGDNLAKISRKYKVSIPDLVKWNGIKDVKKIYVGQKLIIAKGRPDEPTEHELAALTSKAKDVVREARADEKIKSALAKAEADLRAANNTTLDVDLGDDDDHLEKATLANRIMAGEGVLLPSEYKEVDKDQLEKEKKHNDFTSLGARIKHEGKTKEELKEKKDEKNEWENSVKKDEYNPEKDPDIKRQIADQVGMFLLYKIIDGMVGDIVKECTANEMFDESLSGRFFNFHSGKKNVYKAQRRFSNALDYAELEEFKGDASLGSLKSISRDSESDSVSAASSRGRGSFLSRMHEYDEPKLSHNVRTIKEGDEEDDDGGDDGEKKHKRRRKKKKKKRKEGNEEGSVFSGDSVSALSQMEDMDSYSVGSLDRMSPVAPGGFDVGAYVQQQADMGSDSRSRGNTPQSGAVRGRTSPEGMLPRLGTPQSRMGTPQRVGTPNGSLSPDTSQMSIGDEYRLKYATKEAEAEARKQEKEERDAREKGGGGGSVVSEMS
jgi:WD40 repeat protein/tetratricopeptide (TPR) repeat protein